MVGKATVKEVSETSTFRAEEVRAHKWTLVPWLSLYSLDSTDSSSLHFQVFVLLLRLALILTCEVFVSLTQGCCLVAVIYKWCLMGLLAVLAGSENLSAFDSQGCTEKPCCVPAHT